MPIATPPATPNRGEPETFSDYMDAYLSWVSTQLVPGLNALPAITASYSFTDGAAATPSMTFAADPDTGVFRPGANILGFSTAGSEAMRVNGSNQLFINCTNAIAGVNNPRVNIQYTSTTTAMAIMRATADVNSPNIALVKTRGTAADDYAIVQTGDSLGNLGFYGGDGATSILSARISAAVIGTPASGDVRGQLNFATGSGAGAVTTRMFISEVKIGASLPVLVSSGGLGYDTGNGGTVTQLTSRTTGVTLNKLCGEITLFSAAGSATPASFTVTNSQLAATDIVALNVKSGTNTYIAMVTAKAAGSFTVTFWTTGGTATDAPVIGFAIIKAVAA